jgi:hypothetical protein
MDSVSETNGVKTATHLATEGDIEKFYKLIKHEHCFSEMTESEWKHLPQAKRVTIAGAPAGYVFFAAKENCSWRVYEATSGCAVSDPRYHKKEALAQAIINIRRAASEPNQNRKDLAQRISDAIAKHGRSPWVAK